MNELFQSVTGIDVTYSSKQTGTISPTNEQVEESLERVLQSALFKNAERQSRFLRHVVERHLRGDDSALREIAIGFEVYDRRETYDPKGDPIGRGGASRVRSRAREEYETAVAGGAGCMRLS